MKHLLKLKRYLGWQDADRQIKHPKVELASMFLMQCLMGLGVFFACVIFLSRHFSPTNEVFMEMVKSFDASTYVAIAMVMIGYIKIRHSKSYPLALSALFCLLMAVSSQLVSLIPTDIEFGPYNFARRTAIYGPISLMFISLYGITYNLATLVFQSVESDQEKH